MNKKSNEHPKTEFESCEDSHDIELTNYLNSIGANSLASELSDLRFRNRIIESQRSLSAIEAQIILQEKQLDTLDQRNTSNQAALFDKSQSYMNFVVTLGYAGFFAIWNFVKELMNPFDMKVVASLLGTSLLIFIAWTLAMMILGAQSVKRLGDAIRLETSDIETRLENVHAAEQENMRKGLFIQKIWYPVFIFSVLTGFSAGVILLGILIFDIFGVKLSMHDLYLWIRNWV